MHHQRRLPRHFANLQCRTVRDIRFQSTRWHGRWFIGIAPVGQHFGKRRLLQSVEVELRIILFMYSTSRTRPASPGDLPKKLQTSKCPPSIAPRSHSLPLSPSSLPTLALGGRIRGWDADAQNLGWAWTTLCSVLRSRARSFGQIVSFVPPPSLPLAILAIQAHETREKEKAERSLKCTTTAGAQ